MSKIKKFLKKWSFDSKWSDSLEPAIFLFWAGWHLVGGAEISTDMLYRKICEVGMGESFENCANLTNLKDLKLNVTKEVNLFSLRGSFFQRIPPLLFALIGGSIFDNFPKKVFLILPLITACIEPIAEFFNFYFFYSLPVEFMYLTMGTWSYGGGSPMYFMAQYGYISLVASPENRTPRMARCDGMEMLAPIIMIPLSAPVFYLLGYVGIHAVKFALYIVTLLYMFLVVAEPEVCRNTEKKKRTCGEIFKTLATSTIDMFKTIFKKRKGNMRALIFVQAINFIIINISVSPLAEMTYDYVKVIFHITGEEFATFKTVEVVVTFLTMLILVPIVSKKFGVSDPMFAAFVAFSVSAGLFLASAAPTYTWFFIGRLILAFFLPTSCLLRSNLVSCIDPEEIGRVTAGLAILTSLAEYCSEPLFRYIFDVSIDGAYPGLFFLVIAVMYIVMGIVCIFLHYALSRERKCLDMEMENKEAENRGLGVD